MRAWGDDGHRRGDCLFQMGCKGPVTRHNCPEVQWNERTSWPIGCGHPCIGCSEPDFWDTMTPFYTRLSGVDGEDEFDDEDGERDYGDGERDYGDGERDYGDGERDYGDGDDERRPRRGRRERGSEYGDGHD